MVFGAYDSYPWMRCKDVFGKLCNFSRKAFALALECLCESSLRSLGERKVGEADEIWWGGDEEKGRRTMIWVHHIASRRIACCSFVQQIWVK